MARSRNTYTSSVIPNSLLLFHGKTTFSWQFYVAGNNKPYCGLKVTDIKSNRNPLSGSHADICEQMDRQSDMTKVLGASHKYATALKNGKDNIKSSLVKATTNSGVSQVKCHHSATELYHYFAVKERSNINCNCWHSLH